jgi:BioD-like phosphotransacetylase family protein
MMVVGLSTHDAMTKISNYTPKLNIDDTNRVSVAVKHYEQYIDFDELLKRTRTSTE